MTIRQRGHEVRITTLAAVRLLVAHRSSAVHIISACPGLGGVLNLGDARGPAGAGERPFRAASSAQGQLFSHPPTPACHWPARGLVLDHLHSSAAPRSAVAIPISPTSQLHQLRSAQATRLLAILIFSVAMAMVEAVGMTITRWTNAQHHARHEFSHVLFLVTRKLSRYLLPACACADQIRTQS